MKYFIYTLSNPATGEVFYVGVTKNIKRRAPQHSYTSTRKRFKKEGCLSSKDAYILCLCTSPIVHVIQEIEGSATLAYQMERFWISFLLDNGFPLMNARRANVSEILEEKSSGVAA